MASITARKNKNGDIISYIIRVYRDFDSQGNRLKPYTRTYNPSVNMTPKQIEKELNKKALEFENSCDCGYAPDSLTDWLNKFSKKYSLPHINPHTFRHTLASVLCLNGVDTTTISKWLGQKNVTTTLNIYEHILDQGKEQVANCVSDVVLSKKI